MFKKKTIVNTNLVEHVKYIEVEFQKICKLLLEGETIEKEFVWQFTTKLLNFFLREFDNLNSLEKERVNLLKNETDNSVIKILELQRKAIAKKAYYLIKCYILISEKLENIKKIRNNNLVEREAFLLKFEESKNKYMKILKIYNLEKNLRVNNIFNKVDYEPIKIDRVIQEFLITCQEKLKLIRKNSKNLNGEVQTLIDSVNSLIFDDKLENFDVQDPLLSKKIASFLPSEIVKKENLVVLNDDKYECINESFFTSNYIDITSIIANIQLFIQDELDNNNSLELTVDYIISSDNRNLYEELENLLQKKKWQEADRKTSEIFLEVTKKKYSVNITLEDLIHFPRNSFLKLDQLWLKYSDGKYGFSVQKKILSEYEETIDAYDHEAYKYFLRKIGRYKGKFLLSKVLNILNINPQNNKGYFPSIIALNIFRGWSYLFNLIDD